ncbi:uncharacterized protein [Channa argus]|uniref:uncharacterized protein isoform X2 n=1 Tax=Channa argus TaxID=215402 RepID=UPI003521926E
MTGFGRIKMFLFAVMMIQFTVTAQNTILCSFMVGVGINLPCKNLPDDQQNCDSIRWIYSNTNEEVILFERGQIHNEAAVTDGWIFRTLGTNCSLNIQSVKYQQAGRYTCRINTPGHGEDTVYDVSVVNSVTKQATTKPTTVKPVTTKSPASSCITVTTSTPSQLPKEVWWTLVILPVVLAALTVVAFINLKRTKGTRTQMDDNMVADVADPEEGVSYASVTYTKKTKHKAQTKDEGDDEVTYSSVKALSSSSSSSSAAAAFTDSSIVYAAINKQKT